MTKANHGAYQKFIILGILIFICIFNAFISPVFLSVRNISNILVQVALIVITGTGFTLLMISGGLDLSIGAVVALSGTIAAGLSVAGAPIVICYLAGMIIGALIGTLNGILVVGFKITPVIATLGLMNLARGMAFIYAYSLTKGEVSIYKGIPHSFSFIGGTVGGIPVPVIIMVVVVAIFLVIQNFTSFGKYCYAIGGNEETARLSGIYVGRQRFILYVTVGLLAGLSGNILASRVFSGQPGAGVGFEFDVIVAVILGGTSLFGGEGSIFGTIVGALILGVLRNGMNLKGINVFYQYIASGGVLILAVVMDAYFKGKGVSVRSLKEIFRG
jgi:ribose transport system permease protein